MNVRMGEIAVSAQSDCELVALGLGSCIGLAMVDWEAGIAGLAHIVLPESRGDGRHAGKFADLAVPELLARVRSLGARVSRLKVAIAGGARMFALEGTMDVGSRNGGRRRDDRRGPYRRATGPDPPGAHGTGAGDDPQRRR
jgi:chemotaxis protein CheD